MAKHNLPQESTESQPKRLTEAEFLQRILIPQLHTLADTTTTLYYIARARLAELEYARLEGEEDSNG